MGRNRYHSSTTALKKILKGLFEIEVIRLTYGTNLPLGIQVVKTCHQFQSDLLFLKLTRISESLNF